MATEIDDGSSYHRDSSVLPAATQLQLDAVAFLTNGGVFTRDARGCPSLFKLRFPRPTRPGGTPLFPGMMTQIPCVVGPTAWAICLGESTQLYWETYMPVPKSFDPGSAELGPFARFVHQAPSSPPGTPLARSIRRRVARDVPSRPIELTIESIIRSSLTLEEPRSADPSFIYYDPLTLHDTKLVALLGVEREDVGDAGGVVCVFAETVLSRVQLLVWEPSFEQFSTMPFASRCEQLPVFNTWCRRLIPGREDKRVYKSPNSVAASRVASYRRTE